jgi:hypothetical protein
MHICMILPVISGDLVNDAVRMLRRRSIVQVNQRETVYLLVEDGEVGPIGRCRKFDHDYGLSTRLLLGATGDGGVVSSGRPGTARYGGRDRLIRLRRGNRAQFRQDTSVKQMANNLLRVEAFFRSLFVKEARESGVRMLSLRKTRPICLFWFCC